MKKKILLGVLSLGVVVASASMFAAFEAHIINVTAKIENALTVDTTPIEFGSVFPQETALRNISLALSNSFQAEDRVDDVRYVIKQKPKVKGDPYATITPPGYQAGIVAHEYCLENTPTNPNNPQDAYYTYCYPNLCPYLSKHKNANDNVMPTDKCAYPYTPGVGYGSFDCEVDSFHNPFDPANYAYGYLVHSADDKVDNWVIDLAVPCFEGQCDQGYEAWVKSINPDVVDPFDYVLDPGMEAEPFGCDLWIEVTGISQNNAQCGDDIDNDGDGKIDFDGNGNPAMKDTQCTSPFDTSESA
ncbi:MAG: hypothetical protein WA063_02215 [Minisyncoccia bacterium]